jgi:hypothetical protein
LRLIRALNKTFLGDKKKKKKKKKSQTKNHFKLRVQRKLNMGDGLLLSRGGSQIQRGFPEFAHHFRQAIESYLFHLPTSHFTSKLESRKYMELACQAKDDPSYKSIPRPYRVDDLMDRNG